MMLNWHHMTRQERIDYVAECVRSGMTAGMIAQTVTGASRNAVIGYCHRNKLLLPGRGANQGRPRAQPRPRTVFQPSTVKPRPVVEREAIVEVERFKSIVEIQDDHDALDSSATPDGGVAQPISILDLPRVGRCRWPLLSSYLGLRAEDMTFCGRMTSGENVYCGECRRKAIAKPRLTKQSNGSKTGWSRQRK